MDISFDDLPSTKVSFDDIPDASHGIKFDDLPNVPRGASATAAFNARTPEQRAKNEAAGYGKLISVALGLPDLSPSTISRLGADYSKPIGERIAQTEIHVTPADLVKSPFEGALPRPSGDSALAGAVDSIEGGIESLGSPMNAALLGILPGAPGIIQKIAAIGFAGQMASMLPAQKEAIVDANTPRERAKAIGDFALTTAMVIGAANHGLGSRTEVDANLRKGGMSQEQIDGISMQLAQQELAPATPIAREPGKVVDDEIVDGLSYAKKSLLKNFENQSPEIQKQRQASLDSIESQLLDIPREQVNESAARVAQQAPPSAPIALSATEASREGPQTQGVTSEIFRKAQAEVTPESEQAVEQTPGEPASDETRLRTAYADLVQQTGFPDQPIGDVMDAAGITDVVQGHKLIADLRSKGDANVAGMDFSLAPESHRKWALPSSDPRFKDLAIRLEEPSQETPTRVDPMEQLRQLEQDAQEAPAGNPQAEKMVTVLQKLGRVNRDSTKAVTSELRYYSDEELNQLKEHLEIADSEPSTIAKAITGRDVLKESDRPTAYRNEPAGQEGRGHPTADVAKEAFGEDYTGGPGAMGPREASAMDSGQGKTGIRNAIVDQERVKRGLPPRVAPIRRKFGAIWDQAMASFDRNPNTGRDLVNSLKLKIRPLTDLEDAQLTHEQLMRHEAFDEAVQSVNKSETPEELAQANAALDTARNYVFDVYDIGSRAGSENARGLNARRLMVKEDYSLAKMEARKRAENKGAELSQDQLDKVKQAHERITDLEKRVTDTEQALSEASGHEEMSRIYEAEINDIQKEAAKQPKLSPRVLEVARSIVDRWNKDADAARQNLRERLSRTSAGVDPTILLDVAKIVRAHIGEGTLKLAEITARLTEEFGDSVKPYIKGAWAKANQMIDAEKIPAQAKEAVKRGAGKRDKTTGSVKAKLKAAAIAGEELSQRYVADLVQAHIKAGLHGEDAVMAAVTKDVNEAYPNAIERDVRRAYTEYGKVKFPSKEEVATEMRELRTLVRLQESIDRETSGLDSLHTGFQRDKATQSIREKQTKLNELLKKRQGPPSPEALASRDEAKQTALRNSIADLDKQLRTGEKPVRGAPAPDSAATEQLRAERDSMREKLKEIEEAHKHVRTSEEIYNAKQFTLIAKRLAELQDKNARQDFTRPVKRTPPKLTADNQRAKAELEREREKFEEGLAKDRAKNRTNSQKFWDTFVGVERAMKLSSDVVLTKLSTAAMVREAILTPAEELVGGAISKAFPGLAARAPREGGFSLAAEIKAKREVFAKGMEDAYRNLKMQKSDLEVTYGKKGKKPPEWYEYLGFLHAALKAPVKRAEFARSLEKRMLAAAKDGTDLNDPSVMRRLSQESYVDANRAIFMQDNVVATGFSGALRIMENSKIAPRLGPAMSRILQFLVPIVKVPTNIVGEVATGVHGLVSGSVRTGIAYAKGIESIPQPEGDAIMQQLKKGAIGNSLLLLGYFGYKQIGGFYHERDNREASDVQPERYRIGGVDLPPAFGHSTGAMLLNISASMHRVEDEQVKGEPKGIVKGAQAGAAGVVKALPFVPAVTGIVNALETDRGWHNYISGLITSSTTPALTQHIAKVMDTPGTFPRNAFDQANRRAPETNLDAVKMGIPGLRSRVPIKETKR